MNSTPPLSDHNRFSVLSVDNIPEIDEPVETIKVVQTPKTLPPPQRRPKWVKQLPKGFVISALDGTEKPRQSVSLNIELVADGKTLSVQALLDSGATGMFVDREYVKANQLTTRALPGPIPVRNVDRTLNDAGSITEVAKMVLKYKNHSKRT